jgi:hypothetical protein
MNAKQPDDFFAHGDDLSDLLGSGTVVPKPLPADETAVRIRASAPVFEERCRKCSGSGQTRWGACFACKGRGKNVFKTSAAARAAGRAGAERRKATAEADKLETFKAAHPEHWTWIERTIARTDDAGEGSFGAMIRDLPEAIRKWGDLSPGRMAMIERGIARDAEFDAKRQQQAAQAVERSVEVGTAKIEAAFQRRREAGQIRLGLHYDGVFIGPMRNAPTVLRVKASSGWDSTYYGKIEGGRFFPTRACTDEIKARVAAIAADPGAAARVSGKDTGICCCCGRQLTDPVSIAGGIGPICAGKWGF